MAIIPGGQKKILGGGKDILLFHPSWITISLFGTLPYIISGAIPHFTDAFFETISGFTTTGASILTDIEHFLRDYYFGAALPIGWVEWGLLCYP